MSDIELEDYRLRVGGREWSVLHSGRPIGFAEEQDLLSESRDLHPYGLALWPAAIALAHEIAERADDIRDTRVLELGAGTGIPGIVASTLGAHVTQTDRHDVAMLVCRRNGERNRVQGIEYRTDDWARWTDDARYDWIIGADILYSQLAQPDLRRIFETNLAPRGRILLADPFRLFSIRFLDTLEADHWNVSMTKWTVGDGDGARAIGVFQLTR